MSGVSSRIPVVLDALIALLTPALPTLQVRDGAVLQNVERAGLTIGANLDDSEFEWEQDWAGLGHVYRDEDFTVPNILWARSGDNDLSVYRNEVFGYFATIESTLRAAEKLGLDPAWNIRADLRPTRYSQPQTPDGVVCRIDFTIRIQARI